MRETLREFCDRTDRETWKGTSTAFRSGAKAALTNAESGYTGRQDFGDAWKRGFDAMEAFINAGGEIHTADDARVYARGSDGKPTEVQGAEPRRTYRRHIYGGGDTGGSNGSEQI